MIYGYKCRRCGQHYESETRADALDPCQHLTNFGRCRGAITRDYSGIGIARPFVEHYNASVGAPVRSKADFKEKLHVMGEQYTEMSGIPTNYQPIDMDDTRTLGVTEEGLDVTNRERVDRQGLPPIRVP